MVRGEHHAVGPHLEQHADQRGRAVVAAHARVEALAQDLGRQPLELQRRMRGPPGQPCAWPAPRKIRWASHAIANSASPTGAIATAKIPIAIATLSRTAPNTIAISGGGAPSRSHTPPATTSAAPIGTAAGRRRWAGTDAGTRRGGALRP